MIIAYATLVILSILSIVGWLIYLHFEKKTLTPTAAITKIEPMQIASENNNIMSNVVIKKYHKYVSENQQQAWFRKTFLKPRRKK